MAVYRFRIKHLFPGKKRYSIIYHPLSTLTLLCLLAGCTPSDRLVVLCDEYSLSALQPRLDSLQHAGWEVELQTGPGHLLAQKVRLGQPCHWLVMPHCPLPHLPRHLVQDSLLLADTLIAAAAAGKWPPERKNNLLILAQERHPMRHWQDRYLQQYPSKAIAVEEIVPLNSLDYVQRSMADMGLLPASILPQGMTKRGPALPMQHCIYRLKE